MTPAPPLMPSVNPLLNAPAHFSPGQGRALSCSTHPGHVPPTHTCFFSHLPLCHPSTPLSKAEALSPPSPPLPPPLRHLIINSVIHPELTCAARLNTAACAASAPSAAATLGADEAAAVDCAAAAGGACGTPAAPGPAPAPAPGAAPIAGAAAGPGAALGAASRGSAAGAVSAGSRSGLLLSSLHTRGWEGALGVPGVS